MKECPGVQDTPEAEDHTLEADDEKSEDVIFFVSLVGLSNGAGRTESRIGISDDHLHIFAFQRFNRTFNLHVLLLPL